MRSTWILKRNLISLPIPFVNLVAEHILFSMTLVSALASAVKRSLRISEASVSQGKFQSTLQKHSFSKLN